MNTDDLITMLASGPDVRVRRPSARATLLPLAAALLASTIIVLAGLGMRADLAIAATLPPFWIKLAFTLALAAAGTLALKRLSTPGARSAALPFLLAAPVLLIWCAGGTMLWQAAPELRAGLFWGGTWRTCPPLIALISLPLFAAALHLARSLAPTRLRLAGAAAGIAAGAAAAAVYCLHCPEASPVFVGFWYLLGMAIPAALGALIGPRVLAW
ncbi:DUF1109 domain-containing protein [Massilia atriviolacea]|uniref:DUF1109 domain-containing protein n=1 Tax=Massilia atriviolacea TaxID=2495579 RepID=A0A430HK04_9BURK|nr:DUF1109 domain-containing protein [Massilia atriviolacea]RSZ57858.1 DUF1109 domain-containing protein [Massilia atriviolacea]